jgi:hypothetical protein
MASSIINSDDGVISGTSGLKSTGGDDGVLVFQSKGTETAQINTDKQIVAAAGTASLPVLTTTGDVNTGIYFPAADNIGFATGGTIRGRWTTDGLCFGSDTAAANALDDYEEGTWTPAIAGGTSAGTASYTDQDGWYTKIGNTVTVGFFLTYGSATGTGALRITGLPFSSASGGNYAAGSIMASSLDWAASVTSLALFKQAGTSYFEIYVSGDNTSYSLQQMDAAAELLGGCTYRV